MNIRHRTKLIDEGQYVGGVEASLIIMMDEGRSRYLSLDDAYRPRGMQDALSRGHVKRASQTGRTHALTPVT